MSFVKSVSLVLACTFLFAACGKREGVRGTLGKNTMPDVNAPVADGKVVATIEPTDVTKRSLADQNGGKFNSAGFCLRILEKGRTSQIQYFAQTCGTVPVNAEAKMTFTTQEIRPARPAPAPKVSLRDYDLLRDGHEVGKISVEKTIDIEPSTGKVIVKETKYRLEALCPKADRKYVCTPLFDDKNNLVWLN